jgi:hypothetical protein
MNGLWSLIWVTCSWIAFHFASRGAPATSTHVVTCSSGTSIFAANASISSICSGVASSGGCQKLFFPSSVRRASMRARTEAGIACSYSLDGTQGATPGSSNCSGYQAGSPARSNARIATSWVRMWSGCPYPPKSL